MGKVLGDGLQGVVAVLPSEVGVVDDFVHGWLLGLCFVLDAPERANGSGPEGGEMGGDKILPSQRHHILKNSKILTVRYLIS